MKKNRTMRVAVLMLALTLITCCFVGSTFAKYTSSAAGSDSVTVAKWSFKVGTADIATTNEVTFDLFSTILDTKTGETEGDVVTDRIAPGTKGSFNFSLQNASEVTAEYTIVLAPEANGIPIVWSLDGTDYTKTLAEVNAALTDTLAAGSAATTSATVYWQWAFQDGTTATDTADTALGVAGTAKFVVNATITATQVD